MKNQKLLCGLLLVLVAVLVFVANDSFLYKTPIAFITKTKNTFSYENEGPNEETERYYEQKIYAVLLNGARKGEKITFENEYSDSGVNDEKYRFGDQVFVSLGSDDGAAVIGKKRDVYLTFLLGIFICMLFYFNRKHGGIILISLVFNIGVFLVALWQYKEGVNLSALAAILMLIFSIVTLLFAGGIHKKTFVAILATLVTTLCCYGIYQGLLNVCPRIPYEMMDYVVNAKDLSDLFLSGVLMGSLGAVMDVSISIAAGVTEIVDTSPQITIPALMKSVREIGYDIMGTMINVLFFTYISSSIPIVVVKIKNGYTLYHLIHFHLVFDLIRFLMGAIGIVLAIPVAGMFSILLLHGDSVIKTSALVKKELRKRIKIRREEQ